MDWKVFLSTLKDNTVKDLFWVVASPSPVDCKLKPDLFFPENIQDQLVIDHLDYFKTLDAHPTSLHLFLKLHLNNKRLGYLFEALLFYFFRTSPHVEVLLANEQVIVNKETLGEVDFIIKYKGEIYHIESSVKYYLNANQEEKFTYWIGSSGNDDLNSKIQKVVTKQIPVAHHEQIKQKIKKPYTSFLWLKGKFFTNDSLPTWKNKSTEYGSFMTYNSFFTNYRLESNLRYYVLDRPAWMADLLFPSVHLACSWQELEKRIEQQNKNNKALHIGIDNNGNYTTLFLIPQTVHTLLMNKR